MRQEGPCQRETCDSSGFALGQEECVRLETCFQKQLSDEEAANRRRLQHSISQLHSGLRVPSDLSPAALGPCPADFSRFGSSQLLLPRSSFTSDA